MTAPRRYKGALVAFGILAAGAGSACEMSGGGSAGSEPTPGRTEAGCDPCAIELDEFVVITDRGAPGGASLTHPTAVKRQATVGRFAIESTMGPERNQGYEAYRGTRFQGPPQPQTALADRNLHLWRARLPASLPRGVHVIEVTSVDRNGRRHMDRVVFEVMDERPDPLHRTEVWEIQGP